MKPVEVFISFHEADEIFYQELEKHLTALQRENVITCWSQRKILAGTERDQEIDRQLNHAGIILLLMSSDFLASEYHWTVEVTRALEHNESGKARGIVVLLRSVDWETPPIDRLPTLPYDRTPIQKWKDRDEAFVEVVNGIREEVQNLFINRVDTSASGTMVIDEKLRDQVTALINEGDRLHQKNSLEEATSKYNPLPSFSERKNCIKSLKSLYSRRIRGHASSQLSKAIRDTA